MNNEVLQNIRTRRSCRAYTAQPVEPEKLKAILEAGTWAASGHGWQAAKIVVLQDAAEIAELERMNAAIPSARLPRRSPRRSSTSAPGTQPTASRRILRALRPGSSRR